MIRDVIRLATGITLILLVALGVMATSGIALAQAPADPSDASLTFEEPRATGNSISVSVRMTTADGEPIAGQPIGFFVVPDFFGERPMPLQTAITNAQGRATITYLPTWDGTHKVIARFSGDQTYQREEATSVMTVSGLPSTHTSEPRPLNSVRQWASPAAVVVAIAVWLILAGVVGRVGWGIWQAGRREEQVLVLPETARERLRGSTYH